MERYERQDLVDEKGHGCNSVTEGGHTALKNFANVHGYLAASALWEYTWRGTYACGFLGERHMVTSE
jgi:hypothetical protein